MFDFVTAAQNLPFSVALAVMFGIAVLEGITALFGVALSGLMDSLLPGIEAETSLDMADVEIQTPNALSRLLGWLRIGKVPVLILLVIFLTGFGLMGLLLQSFMHDIFGYMLPAYIAIVPALIVSLPIVRVLGGMIALIMPKDETEAVSRESFIGRVATITLGVAKAGSPAEAKIRDQFGATHYIMVEPDLEQDEFDSSTALIIVKRDGHVFKVIKNENISLVDA